MLFVSISTRIVLFPGYVGGEKPTLPGNAGICTGTCDDTFLNCQGLWLECLLFHYTLAIGLYVNMFSLKIIDVVKLYAYYVLVSLTPTRKHLTLLHCQYSLHEVINRKLILVSHDYHVSTIIFIQIAVE